MKLPQIISAIVTPFHSDGSIDFSTFKKLINDQIDNKIEGIVVFGTTGECPTLTKEEKIKLFFERKIKELNEGDQPQISLDELGKRVSDTIKAFDENK